MRTLSTLLLSLFTACAIAQTINFTIDGNPRSTRLHLPTGYSTAKKYPLVLNLHGYTSNAFQQESYCMMNSVADTAGFIVVYPDGLICSGTAQCWNSFDFPLGANDIKFLNALIDTMLKNYSVDAARVYSCGMSNGGFMSYTLACALSNRLAAVASVTGTISTTTMANCPLVRNMPVLDIHGTADPTVNYQTGIAGAVGVEQTIAFWRDTNNCLGKADTTHITNSNLTDNCTVQLIHYKNCAGNSEVMFYKVIDGGHTWPGAFIDVPMLGHTNRDINASAEIWKFFSRHRLTTVGMQEITATSFSVSPNPTNGTIVVHLPGKASAPLQLFNSSGLLIYEEVLPTTPTTIPMTGWPAGIYVVKYGNTVQKLVKEH